MWKLSLGTCLFTLSHSWNQRCLTKKGYFITRHGLALPFSSGRCYDLLSLGRKTSVDIMILDWEMKLCLNTSDNDQEMTVTFVNQNTTAIFVDGLGAQQPTPCLRADGNTLYGSVRGTEGTHAAVPAGKPQQGQTSPDKTLCTPWLRLAVQPTICRVSTAAFPAPARPALAMGQGREGAAGFTLEASPAGQPLQLRGTPVPSPRFTS